MDRSFKVCLLAAVLISVLTAVSPLQADVIDMYCYLEAGNVDAYVVVWEEDRQGNNCLLYTSDAADECVNV